MTTHLENFATRLEDDQFFLACPLRVYAKTEGLDDNQLAASLGCGPDVLLRLRLCRAPAADATFQRDIEAIVNRFGVRRDALIEAVRRGQIISKMRGDLPSQQGFLMAARDAEGGNDTDSEEGAAP